jgi:hypothetical protein
VAHFPSGDLALFAPENARRGRITRRSQGRYEKQGVKRIVLVVAAVAAEAAVDEKTAEVYCFRIG